MKYTDWQAFWRCIRARPKVISAPGKYISTQFDLKRRPVQYKEECVLSRPWSDVKEMETCLKRYVQHFPYKVHSIPPVIV